MERVVKFDWIFITSDRQEATFEWMKKNIVYFPSHIASLSRFCCKYCESIVDFIAMHAMMLAGNSSMVECRPTGISFI